MFDNPKDDLGDVEEIAELFPVLTDTERQALADAKLSLQWAVDVIDTVAETSSFRVNPKVFEVIIEAGEKLKEMNT